MRLALSLLTSVVLLGAMAPVAVALNNDDALVKAEIAYNGTCYMVIPRPDDAAGDPRPDGQCSCVLVGPDVVLTASQCLALNVEESPNEEPLVDGIQVFFESNGGGTEYAVTEIELYRHYDAEVASVDGLSGTGRTEFALARLDQEVADKTIATVNTTNLAGAFEGAGVAIVGFGKSAGEGANDFGTKRAIETIVRDLTFTHFSAGSMDNTTCPGDAGAPIFADLGDGPVLVAITAFDTLLRCFENVNRMRVDRVAADFILAYVNRFHGEGDCLLNDVCSETACDVPDPDCDPCLWQGGGAADCDETCAPRDYDCDYGVLPGFACEDDSDCEFGASCIAAEDDSSFSYCSNECDENGVTAPSTCSNALSCSSGACEYGTPSRGSQGFTCSTNEECRSGICEGNICVFECTGTCPMGTECLPSSVSAGVNVCRVPGDSGGGGFCAASGDGSSHLAWLAIFGAVLFAGTRRRKRA